MGSPRSARLRPVFGLLSAGSLFLASAAAAFAEPVVTSARIERGRTGIKATVKGEMTSDDWGTATVVDVDVADETARLAAPQLRQSSKTLVWTFTDATGAVVRTLKCDLRRGRFQVRCRTSDATDYADPFPFALTFTDAFRWEIPVNGALRVSKFRGRLSPLPDDPPPPPPPPPPPDPDPDPEPAEPARVVAYFTAWGIYARNYQVKNIETSGAAARLTHLNYAFADIGTDLRAKLGDEWADIGRTYTAEQSVDGIADPWDPSALRGNFLQLKELKARFPDLRVLISLGGWTWSGRFSDAALTAQSRATFVTSCIDLFIRGQFAAGITEPGIFDGIDVDWEWPGAPGATNNYRPEDTANFTALLREFRSQLDARGTLDGRTYLLTIAAPAGEANIGKIDVAGIAPYVDGVNLMSYDFRGGWSATTGHQAALHQPAGDPLPAERWWIDNAVELWTNGGFPASKLTVGMPFYGRGWTGVSAGPAGDGLWQTTTGAAPGTYEAGIEDADVLAQLPSSYVRYHDAAAGASWLYDPTARVFWTWDDASSLGVKAAYIREKGLAGAMVWELSGDDASGTLLRSLTDALNR